MPRYVVERTFPNGLHVPVTIEGAKGLQEINRVNAQHGVNWVNSYVTEDKKKTFCVYDAPNPEAIRTAAEQNKLPIDRITRTSVLDPHFYV